MANTSYKKKPAAPKGAAGGGSKTPGRTKTSAMPSVDKHNQLWAVVLFAVGLLTACITFIEGQNVWKFLHNGLFGLFGIAAFLLAPLVLYIAVMAALGRFQSSVGVKLGQGMALVVLICGLVQVISPGAVSGNGFWGKVGALFQQGAEIHGGGVAAAFVGWPLMELFGNTGAGITIILFAFVFVMVLTGFTLLDLFRSVKKPVAHLRETYVENIEANEELKKARFNIDVDLGPAEDLEMPVHPVKADKTLWELSQERKAREEKPAVSPESKKTVKKPGAEKPVLKVIRPLKEEPGQEEPTAEIPSGKTLEPERKAAPLEDIINKALSMKENAAQAETLKRDLLSGETEDPQDEMMEREPVEFVPKRPAGFDGQEADFPEAEEEPLAAAKAGSAVEIQNIYSQPPVSLLAPVPPREDEDVSEELKANAALLVDTLKSFGVQTRITNISCGPAVTRYELQPSAGVKISKITGLADDIALNLAAAGVRIEAPIPNKPAVGIEVPNKNVGTVKIREIIDSASFAEHDSRLAVALGRDIAGNITIGDIAKFPHVLIAGATGSGKSVCINSIIISLLYKSSPEEVRLLMVDPKVVELGIYNGIPHLLVPVVTDPKKAAGALGWAVNEMLGRYKLFADNSVRDLNGFNRLARTREDLTPMPQIVIIIDELADLMMAAPNDVEDAICRLAQMARAAGMHLVIATQRPSVDVITGVIKANIPSRIAFAVSSQVDSRTILDASGAEKLLGRGDMLFYPVGAAKPLRVQGCFVSDEEVERVVGYIKENKPSEYDENIMDEIEKQAALTRDGRKKAAPDTDLGDEDSDSMFQEAVACVVEAGQASTSMLQRRLKLGYARAARIIDQMEERGIVGPFEGGKREVLMTRDQLAGL